MGGCAQTDYDVVRSIILYDFFFFGAHGPPYCMYMYVQDVTKHSSAGSAGDERREERGADRRAALAQVRGHRAALAAQVRGRLDCALALQLLEVRFCWLESCQ